MMTSFQWLIHPSGIYFTDNAAMSATYATAGSRGTRLMILAEV